MMWSLLLLARTAVGGVAPVSDADAQAYISAVQIADGGVDLEVGVREAINSFVVGCKADGIWTAIKASGAITFAAPAGFTAKVPATTPTLTAGRTYDVIASVVGGGTVLDYRYGGDGYTT